MTGKEKVLKAIVDYIAEHQYPPSVRELCDMTGLKSTSSINRYITKLLEEGKLETDSGIGAPRALRVPGYKFVKNTNGKQ